MTELEEKCFKIAEKYHAGQVDKGGHPYIEHPVAVAAKLDTEIEKCVGLLHDIIEDTEVTYEMLLEMGVPKEVADKVLIMTHKPEDSYEDYIKRIAQDEVTRKVKMADMEHNMDLSRIPDPTQKDLDRIENKYRKWYGVLAEK